MSQDRTTALQPGQQSKTLSQKKKKKRKEKENATANILLNGKKLHAIPLRSEMTRISTLTTSTQDCTRASSQDD